MRKYLFPVIVLSIALFSWSCYYDNEEFLYHDLGTGCDTISVTFTTTIKPLLSDNCYGCHSNSTAASFGNNIKLENYADVVSRTVAVAGSIAHIGGYSPMPKNGGKLNSCLTTQFTIWVDRGLPEN